MNKALELATAPEQNLPDSTELKRKPDQLGWRWIALICLLIGLSGGLRYWRDRQFQSLSDEGEKPPFALKDFPQLLGGWQTVEGSEEVLDPEVARVAGSSDHFIRKYTNIVTGENLSVMVIYGLANQVWAHTPEVCYPSAGFRPIASPEDTLKIQTPDGKVEVVYRKQRFAKVKAGEAIIQEVYYTFRNAGQWGPDMGQNWKVFRYYPGMFKIQIQRQMSGTANGRPSGGANDDSNAEQLLALIAQEIEQRLTAMDSRTAMRD